MKRQVSPAARLAAALLLVGLVAIACGRPGIAPGDRPTGADAATASAQVETIAPDQPSDASPQPPDDPASPDPSAPATEPDTSAAPSSGTDPVAGDLQSIDQLLKSLDGSLSGADAGE